jgi:hypothetical protein
MPLRHQGSKNHKEIINNKLHLVKLSVLSAFVAKNGSRSRSNLNLEF